jgi:hypothetical protein
MFLFQNKMGGCFSGYEKLYSSVDNDTQESKNRDDKFLEKFEQIADMYQTYMSALIEKEKMEENHKKFDVPVPRTTNPQFFPRVYEIDPYEGAHSMVHSPECLATMLFERIKEQNEQTKRKQEDEKREEIVREIISDARQRVCGEHEEEDTELQS